MKPYILFSLLCLSLIPAFGQKIGYDYYFRSTDNPHYWGNRKPYPNYWQQDVAYTIEARLDDSTDILHGETYELTYWNNSPDTLTELYFHLFTNAFQPGSHYHELWLQNDREPEFGAYEEEGLNLEISKLKVNGQAVDTILDNTILRVNLNKPLYPGDSLQVSMQFKQYFEQGGSMRRRMKVYEHDGVKHFDAVHWYPSICVYDHKFGWTTEQHLDKEFYHDFGSFDVKVTLPEEYILDGTGVLQNKEQVLPENLRRKLDLANFKDKPWESKPGIIIEPSGKTKTWHFYAQDVHNFAWTADPTYRIGEVKLGEVTVRALAQEGHASKWQQTAGFTAAVINTYSRDFGSYDWPKIIAADANDGMEYPMLTLDGGSYPQHQGLIAHEVGHMWFYGMLGSNEAYRAFMDEGFTQFLTVWSMDELSGHQKFLDNMTYNRFARSHFPYVKTVHEGFDYPLNTHSSQFRSAIRQGGGYGLVYVKASTMLYSLKYVLGDSLFRKAMKHYVKKWKFCHPYPEDFRATIIDYTGADLNWFFDQWLTTTKSMDYAVEKVKKKGKGTYSVTFERKGEMQMPVDFDVYTEEGDTLKYHIPNTWFEKPTERKVLDKWYGFGKMYPTYTAEIEVDGKIKGVKLDPEDLTGDVYRLDNKWKRPMKIHYDLYQEAPGYDWTKFHHYIRPALWYYSYDGLKVGLNARGSYMGNDHKYNLSIWGSSGLLKQYDEGNAFFSRELKDKNQPIAYLFRFQKSLWKYNKGLSAHLLSEWNTGLNLNHLYIDKEWRRRDSRNPNYTKLRVGYKSMYRNLADGSNYLYLFNPGLWGTFNAGPTLLGRDQHNSSAYASLLFHRKKEHHSHDISLGLRTPVLTEYNYSYLEASYAEKRSFMGNKINALSRVYVRLGYDAGDAPYESLLYLAEGSPEKMQNQISTRARGYKPVDVLDYREEGNTFQYAGGLNLRAYSRRILSDGFVGFSGYAANTEIDFDKAIYDVDQLLPKWAAYRLYVFGDLGGFARGISIYEDQFDRDYPLYTDAGIGTSLKITFGKYSAGVEPLVLRLDLPFYVNRPIPGEDPLDFRWVFGVNSLF